MKSFINCLGQIFVRSLLPYAFGALLIMASLVLAPIGHTQSEDSPVLLQRVSQFSGKVVPRFESLRSTEVNGRIGPSLDHPVRWHYKRVGLPMMVIMETRDWSKVRDPDGAEVWIFNQLLSSRPTIVSQKQTILRKQPSDAARGIVRIAPSVVMDVVGCTSNWCRVRLERRKGWVQRADIWGATQEMPLLEATS